MTQQDHTQPVAVVDAPRALDVHPSMQGMTALAVRDAAPVAHAPQGAVQSRIVQGVEFTEERIALLTRTIAKDATPDELDLFLYTCKRLRLDPFARQINFMKRGRDDDKIGRAEVSIDGLRLVAERTGDYQGQTPPEWADVRVVNGAPVITWFPVWPYPERNPYAARVGVYRRGFRDALVAIARFDAYAQYKSQRNGGGLNSMWAKMGPEQLAKCAEALALRKAFPHELSGVYTDDEMQQADAAERDDAAQRAHAEQQEKLRQQREEEARRAAEIAKLPRRFANEKPVAFMLPGKHKGVPLDAQYPPGHEKVGEYVVGDALLVRARDFLAGKVADTKTTAADRQRLQVMHDAVAREITTRAMEASEPAPRDGGHEPVHDATPDDFDAPEPQAEDDLPF